MSDGRTLKADVAIVGGGLGGVAAALAALRRGHRVVLTEESDWLGGQLTSQGVPPDEHSWIEQFGCTASYRNVRDQIRNYYRHWYPLTETARMQRYLNPGEGRVSGLCHEPRVAAAVLDAMLSPYVAAGRLNILTGYSPVSASVEADRVRAVSVADVRGNQTVLEAAYVVDATELGELLPLAGVEHVSGFESSEQTGEPNAPDQAQPANMQAFSWCFAVDHVEGADNTIDKPADYALWQDYQPPFWPDRMLSLNSPDPRTLAPVARQFVPNPAHEGPIVADQSLAPGDHDLWVFRRLLSRHQLRAGFAESDITLVNWAMIDYLPGPLIGVSDRERHNHLAGARQLSLSVLYWLQTEAPRPDGGTGWPGLRLRGDVMGTTDGFAQAPYIRESRRIQARYTIVEQDLSLAVRGEHGAKRYDDSVGVGMYRIDLHPSTGGDNYIDVASCPYQIPLGALIPVRVRNLLPAAKNIGTTHITNGCYRLHPTEWNIGEVVGSLAAHCLEETTEPAAVREEPARLEQFQKELTAQGVELSWPEVRGY